MKTKLVTTSDASALAKYHLENASHLGPWEPSRESGYHSIDSWRVRLQVWEQEQRDEKSAYFILQDISESKVVATCFLTNIVRGPFQACSMGYSVSEYYQGKGYMKALCSDAIDYAFNKLCLNRVMANYMPANLRSKSLLKSLGFAEEGFAKKYLKINGKWEDHILTSLINTGKN